ncbi:phosphate ABC transporter substrate-binding protein [Azohydromonas aeria]|uniref:phosphate ABC transporter substrate-binding protein n=1 Tax=Azohydromonas aeria TaxID=2590212 RepID=UPI0012F94191|nr:phosphate ABC transporter substrate-binding protein [Azohydromonas aeria]
MRYLLAAVSLAATLLLLGLSGPAALHVGSVAAPDAGRLRVVGSSTMTPLVAAMARRFEELHPAVRIEVDAGGSGRGLSEVREGRADVGMVSRPLDAGEQDLRALPIARDGVAVVLHRDNPVTALSHEQVRGIYTGRLVNWKQLGGRDAPIFVIDAEPGHGTPELFLRHFRLAAHALRPHAHAGDNGERLRLLSERPTGIAYLSVGEAELAVRSGTPIRPLADNGVAATSRNIGRGNYPLARPLALVTLAGPGTLAQAFVAFCASSQVTDLIQAHGSVPYLD